MTRSAAPTPLRDSPNRAAAQLGAAPLKQCSPTSPGPAALLGASQGHEKRRGATAERVKRRERTRGKRTWLALSGVRTCAGDAVVAVIGFLPKGMPGNARLYWSAAPLQRASLLAPGRRRATQGRAGKGRALFEGRRPELRSPRPARVAQGTPRSGAPTWGRLFFADFLLAKQKKVRSPVNGETKRWIDLRIRRGTLRSMRAPASSNDRSFSPQSDYVSCCNTIMT